MSNQPPRPGGTWHAVLTPQEQEIMHRIVLDAGGFKPASKLLGVSVQTVEAAVHGSRMMPKTVAKLRDAIAYASSLRDGLAKEDAT